MNLKTTLVALSILLSGQALAADFYQDFRGRPLPGSVHPVGAGLETALQTDSGGIRITLAAERSNRHEVGIATSFPVLGDFEMTVGYELLQMEQPKTGHGSGFEFFLMTADKEAIGITRMVRPEGDDVYWCSRNTTGPDGKRIYKPKKFPANGTSGRLRMTRAGSEVVCSAAEGTAEDFRELCRFDFVPDPATLVRLTANPGNSPSAVDLRIVDLRIHADTGLPEAFDASREKPHRLSALLGLLVIVVLTSACFVGWWAYWRRARVKEAAP